MMIVVYYSRAGHVAAAAKNYARQNGADILEIRDLVSRKGVFGFVRAGMQAVRKQTTPIAPITVDLAQYDRVVVCSPVWAGTMACPVRTFLTRYGSSLREVEYLIMRAAKTDDYACVFDEMDAVCGKKRVKAVSLIQGETLS
jgi:multimeric flavodoxin WrbA